MALNVSLSEFVGKRVQINMTFANAHFVREGTLASVGGKVFVLEGTPSGDRWINNGRYASNVLLAAHPKRITHIIDLEID